MIFRKPLVAGTAVAALMLASGMTFAQEAAPAAPAETPATEAPATDAPADAPAAGAAGTETPGAVEEIEAAVEGLPSQNWLKVCDPLEDGQKACLLRQVVLANGQFLGSFLLRDDPGQESRLLAVAAVPVGVLLPFGLTWQIDNAEPVRVPYMLCDPQSCSAQLVVNEQYINSLKRGGKLTLTAKNRQNQDLDIEIDLAGFTATYDGDAALTFEQLQQQESGENALEQVLQDRAEQLRQQLDGEGAAPADGAAPSADGAAAPADAPAETPAQ